MPHIATQKKVHQNSVTYIPPTPASKGGKELDWRRLTGARQRRERLSVKGKTCGTRIALVAAVTVHCWCLSLDELGNYFNRWDTGYHPGAGQKKKSPQIV